MYRAPTGESAYATLLGQNAIFTPNGSEKSALTTIKRCTPLKIGRFRSKGFQFNTRNIKFVRLCFFFLCFSTLVRCSLYALSSSSRRDVSPREGFFVCFATDCSAYVHIAAKNTNLPLERCGRVDLQKSLLENTRTAVSASRGHFVRVRAAAVI